MKFNFWKNFSIENVRNQNSKPPKFLKRQFLTFRIQAKLISRKFSVARKLLNLHCVFPIRLPISVLLFFQGFLVLNVISQDEKELLIAQETAQLRSDLMPPGILPPLETLPLELLADTTPLALLRSRYYPHKPSYDPYGK